MAKTRLVLLLMALTLAACRGLPVTSFPTMPPTASPEPVPRESHTPFPTFPPTPLGVQWVRVTATPFLTSTQVSPAEPNLATPTATLFKTPTPSATPGPPIRHLPLDTEVTLTEIQMINSNEGWGIGGIPGRDAHLLRTSDAGETWRDVSPPVPRPEPGKNLAAAGSFLDSQSARVVFYVPLPERGNVQTLVVWHTDDGGATWAASRAADLYFIGVPSLQPLVRFVDLDHGWILIRYGGIGMHKHPVALLATVDGGETWHVKMDYGSSALFSCTKSGVAFGDPLVGFATIADCPIDGIETDWTYDGGLTWLGRMTPLPQDHLDNVGECDAHSPQFVSASLAFAAADCTPYASPETVAFLFSTRDAGASWEIRRYPGGTLLFIDENTGWALGRDIYQTTDSGLHWERVKTVTWDGQFSFVSPSEGWAVARSDGEVALVRTLDGGTTWALLEPVIGR